MTVADFCARIGCTVEELVERTAGPTPAAPASTEPKAPRTTTPEPMLDAPFRQARMEFERRYLEHVLAAENGNRSRASRRAGIARSHFHELLRRMQAQ